MAGRQKAFTGTVVSDKMEKTVIVLVEQTKQHRLYRKILRRTKRYMAHDDQLEAKPGDLVRIVETRPYSRHKRWRVAEIIKRGEVPEIEAREIDIEYLTREREREVPPDELARRAAAEAGEPAAGEATAEMASEASTEADAQAEAEDDSKLAVADESAEAAPASEPEPDGEAAPEEDES